MKKTTIGPMTLSKEQVYNIQPLPRKQWIARGTYKDGKPRQIVMTSSERP